MLFIHFKTLFSFDFYHRTSLAPKKGLILWAVYLFLLSLLMLYFASGSFLNKTVPIVLKNFPVISFEKGVLVAPKNPVTVPVPYTDFTMVFDASDKATPPTPETNQPVLWVHNNMLYLFAGGQTQTRKLPSEMTFTTTPETLEKYQVPLLISLRLAILIAGLVLIPFVMFLSFVLAFATGFMFKLLRLNPVPPDTLARWSLFLLGPLSVLWYIHLWVSIPLFSLAQLILCIIYMQQIFNCEDSHAN